MLAGRPEQDSLPAENGLGPLQGAFAAASLASLAFP